MSAPSAPNIFPRPKCGSGNLRFFWRPPVSDGGSPVTQYTLACSSISFSQDLSANQSTYTVSGLTNGTDYVFTITATNANGTGPAATFRTVQPGVKPFGPTSTTASTINASTALITWNLSTIANEGATRWFLITALPSSVGMNSSVQQAFGTDRSRPFRGLSTNISYQFLVQGINDVGYCKPFAFTSSLFMPQPSFAPDQISGLQVWLDASGSSNFVLSGSNVVRWLDRSGNGRNGSTVTGLVAVQSNTLNGRPTVFFSTSHIAGFSTFSNVPSTIVTSAFMVYQFPGGVPEDAKQLTVNSGTGINDRRMLYKPLNNTNPSSIGTVSQQWEFGPSYTAPANNTYFQAFAQHLLHYDNITVNGSNIATGVFTRGSNYTYNAWAIGPTMRANVAEMLLYHGVMNNIDRQRVEGYLAWKWGLTASLDPKNPFKGAAPRPEGPFTTITSNRIIHYDMTSWSSNGNWSNLGSFGASHNAALVTGTRQKNAAGNGAFFNSTTYYQVSTLGLVSTYTLSAWARLVSTTFTGGSIFTERDINTAPAANAMNMALLTTNCNVNGYFIKQSGQSSLILSTVVAMSNYWFQYAYTVSTLNNTSTLCFTYSNGAMLASSIGLFSTTTNNKEYYIGARGDVLATNIRYFGDIGEISVYNTPLTSNQIRQNYEARWAVYYPG